MAKRRSEAERFWVKVQKTDSCWTWMAATYKCGYGAFAYDGGMKAAHRWAYKTLVGPIPEGMLLDHTCHNRACVNPAHLRLATEKLNAQNLAGAHRDNPTGELNVQTHSNGRFRVRVMGKHIGLFDTIEEAREAARLARLDAYTFNINDRRVAA